MSNKTLSRVLRIYPHEIGLTLALGFILFVNSAAQQIAGVVAVSGFLSNVGTNQILIVWVITYSLVTLAAGSQIFIIDRINRPKLIQYLCLAFAGIFVVMRLMFALNAPSWISYSLLYIIADQQWLTFPLVLWVLANDSMDMAQAKRLFPLIAGIGLAGKIIGNVAAGSAPVLLSQISASTTELLTLIVVLYLVAFVVARWRFNHVKSRPVYHKDETVNKVLTEAWSFVNDVPAFRYLAILGFCLAIGALILEFNFLGVTQATFNTQESYAAFYSIYRIGVLIVSFLLQTFITSRLINRITLRNTFLIMPIMVFAGFAMLLAMPGIVTAVCAWLLCRIPRESFNEAAHKTLRSLVPEDKRGRVSLFMDNILTGVGAVTGCIITGVIVVFGPSILGPNYPYAYLVVGAIVSAIGLWAVFQVRGVYEKSMLNWRLKKSRSSTRLLDKLDL